ncbi:hypothetical protein [Magnetospira sp. QH-2]|uniref:hypothetical protein n=1 Tax=Magnetospira sp. (strain QH-2) TaxID=1288970 RepID=UPI0003E81183|nr:hypothetical protein [Magnetospira sp. QH-2]CCQ74692.1 protein of unknown function [Magnetospira sp. QH-2]
MPRPVKWVLWLLLAAVVLPLPLLMYKQIASNMIGGVTEIEHLANLPETQRKALEADMMAQVDAGQAHLLALSTQGKSVIEVDKRGAYAVVQAFIRELVGRTKILRFPSLESSLVVPGKPGVFSIRSAVIWWEGREYRPAPFESVVIYEGDGKWRLDWLNIQRRKGKIRVGQKFVMPGFEGGGAMIKTGVGPGQ